MSSSTDTPSTALAQELDAAKTALRQALLVGDDTTDARARVAAAGTALAERARHVMQQRSQAEAARRQVLEDEGVRIATYSIEKLKLSLAELAAPRMPVRRSA